MANVIQPSGKEGFATGAINWPSDDIRIVLLDSAYVYSSSDDFLNDIAAGARVATSGALQNKTATGGILDADDITLSAVAGDPITQGYYYKHTGVEATARLIVYFNEALGIIYTPDGDDIRFQHADGADKIAAL